jgi:hypothetical protein
MVLSRPPERTLGKHHMRVFGIAAQSSWVRRAHRCLSGSGVPWPLSVHWCLWGSQVDSGMAGAHFLGVSARLRFGRYQGESGRCADIAFL